MTFRSGRDIMIMSEGNRRKNTGPKDKKQLKILIKYENKFIKISQKKIKKGIDKSKDL